MEKDTNAKAATANELSFLADNSPTRLEQIQTELVQGSVISAIQCLASDWATKSQTNFYIPDEYYPGYTYLSDNSKIRHSSNAHSHSPSRRAAFVNAEEPNNLHPHHYITTNSLHMPNMTSAANHSTTNLLILDGGSMYNTAHHPLYAPPLHLSLNAVSITNPMTVPYIHPRLEMPVPPLHLPWYFGALCWSFSLAGTLMLYLPPKWALCGGGRSGQREEHRRHWFPFRAFALLLTFVQGPGSFLADYIHMTNISPWHAIDRIIACTLMSLELVKLLVVRPYTRPLVYLAYLACCGGAIFCFLKSQESQETLNAEGFVFWHCGWHCYPITSAVVYLVDNFLNRRFGEHYAFDCEVEKEMYTCNSGGKGVITTRSIGRCGRDATKGLIEGTQQ